MDWSTRRETRTRRCVSFNPGNWSIVDFKDVRDYYTNSITNKNDSKLQEVVTKYSCFMFWVQYTFLCEGTELLQTIRLDHRRSSVKKWREIETRSLERPTHVVFESYWTEFSFPLRNQVYWFRDLPVSKSTGFLLPTSQSLWQSWEVRETQSSKFSQSSTITSVPIPVETRE